MSLTIVEWKYLVRHLIENRGKKNTDFLHTISTKLAGNISPEFQLLVGDGDFELALKYLEDLDDND